MSARRLAKENRRPLQLFLAGLLLACTFSVHAASYQWDNSAATVAAYPWIDISPGSGTPGTSVNLGDDVVSGAINLGFTFNYAGTDYTQLQIGSNGWLSLGGALNNSAAWAGTYVNAALPQAVTTTPLILPFWDDLQGTSVAGEFMYRSFGVAPNRYFVVSYLAVKHYNLTGAYTLQAQIYENGSFVYRYGATTNSGASATVGYQVSGTDFIQYSFNAASEANNTTILWTRNPAVIIPGRFNAFETNTAAGSITGAIKTKLAGTAFNVDLVAINAAKTGVNAAFTGAVKVELLDSSDNTGRLDANDCRSTWANIQTIAPNPTFIAANNGRRTQAFTEPKAWRDVRVRVTDVATGLLIGCSMDNFSIRPTSFTSITSGAPLNMNNTGTSGAPSARAGTDTFTLIATTGVVGYDGTPKIDSTKIAAHTGAIQVGLLSGTFPAAASATGTSTGTSVFTYSEVGNFQFLGGTGTGLGDNTARGVYDDTFTAVDQPNDCTADFSNTAVAAGADQGEYGCKFGITANTSFFGRFYPDHFVLSAPVLPTSCHIQTTGTTSVGSPTVTAIGSTTGFAVGDSIFVRGAGVAGADLIVTINAINAGPTFTLSANASTAVVGAVVDKLGFTYQGQALGLGYTITAQNGLGVPTTTKNYDRATWAGTAGTVALQAENSNNGTDLSARIINATSIAINPWVNGVYTVTSVTNPTAQFSRPTVADGPFDSLQIGVKVIDADGPVLQGRNMDPTTAGACGGACTGVSIGTLGMRFGRLKLSNAHGSELLDLPVPMETQYWNGSVFATNTADSCTTIQSANISLVKTPAACTASVSGNVSFSSGLGNLKLLKPGAACTADMTVNLGAAAENKTYLQGKWSGANYDKNPTGRATFGVYKGGPVIYMREIY